MRTVTDFKKSIHVGTKLHTIYHCETQKDEQGNVMRDPQGQVIYTNKDLGEAPVTIIQSTQFAVERIKKDGTKADSWCKFPKASESEVKDNSITIFELCDRRGRLPVLTYTLIES